VLRSGSHRKVGRCVVPDLETEVNGDSRSGVPDLRHFNTDPDPAFHFDADPDPTFHSGADPDCTFQSDGDPDPTSYFFPDLDPPMLQNGPLRLPPFHFEADLAFQSPATFSKKSDL
jgi:hypothetical protein